MAMKSQPRVLSPLFQWKKHLKEHILNGPLKEDVKYVDNCHRRAELSCMQSHPFVTALFFWRHKEQLELTVCSSHC
jgi:hypothetical protein